MYLFNNMKLINKDILKSIIFDFNLIFKDSVEYYLFSNFIILLKSNWIIPKKNHLNYYWEAFINQ